MCEVLGITHPIALGGMPLIYNSVELTAAVSEAGGIGIVGCTYLDPDEITRTVARVTDLTDRPFGLNSLMFLDDTAGYEAMLAAMPPLVSLAWPRKDQEIEPWIDAAHRVGSTVSFMAADVEDATRGAESGADLIVVQGTEGGGHVGSMALSVLLPMVVDAVAPIPVIAAGGIADGRGLAAALAYGAEGALLGTRFLATQESGLHRHHKQAIVDSDGHDTVTTRIPDTISGVPWPPEALSRVKRNRLIEQWEGREDSLAEARADVAESVLEARRAGDRHGAPLYYGQDAGLISDIPEAGPLVQRIVSEAEAALTAGFSAVFDSPPPQRADEDGG